jgi:hypothetical protein
MAFWRKARMVGQRAVASLSKVYTEAQQARSAGLQSLTACRVWESSVDASRERYPTESRHSYIILEAFLCGSPHCFRHHFQLPLL